MKKVLIGCGVAVVVLGISGAFGAYYFFWRPAKAYVTQFAKLKEIPQLNQQVRNTATFSPPSDNVLTNDSVERFVRTQETIATKLGQQLEEFTNKYRLLSEKIDAKQKFAWTELASAYRDLAGVILEAKRAQVDALNQNNFSLTEYDWTRRRVYEAAGIPINADFEKVLRAISEGNISEPEKQMNLAIQAPTNVPEKNRALVTPYTKGLTDRAVLAVFGL